jgi:hypothetical protein
MDSAGIAAIHSLNGVFGVSMAFFGRWNYFFLLLPLATHLTLMVIFKEFPGSRNKTPNTPVIARSLCPARVSGTGFSRKKPRANPENPDF